MKDFYEKAIALRQKYLSEADIYLDVQLKVLSQIVASVFANGDEIPDSFEIQYVYEEIPHGVYVLISTINEVLTALSIEMKSGGGRFTAKDYYYRITFSK